MAVELDIIESVTSLDTTVVTVNLVSASTPGPAGPGVAPGGTVGQVLTKDSSTDFDTSWQDSTGGGGGAPSDATYLVTASNTTLSAEVVVGATPGGELGGTWASPTVDTVHSGSSHASVQSAAEATAAAALAAHEADSTGVHGITDTSALALTANVVPNARALTAGAGLSGGGDLSADRSFAVNVDDSTVEINTDTLRVKDGGITSAKIADGTIAVGDLAFDPATQTELDAHINDTSAAHAASAVSVSSTTLSGTGTDVQAVFEEIDNLLDDHSARHEDGGADEISLTGLSGAPADTVNKALYDANTVLAADTDNTPAAVTMGASTILARLAAGNIKAASTSEIRTLLDVPTNAEAVLDTLIDAKGDLLAGTAADTIARVAVGTDGFVLTADSGQTPGIKWAAAAASVEDTVADVFGAADTAFEFSSSSLTGLTALSPTPDVEAAHTIIPGCYFLRDDASGTALCGRYAAKTQPFTAITRVTDANPRADFHGAGLFIGEATPGVLNTISVGFNSTGGNRRISTDVWTNPTTYSSTPNTDTLGTFHAPLFFGIRVNSNTSVDFMVSYNGQVWWAITTARNPSITIGSVGLFIKSLTTTPFGASFDYLRIWNSAKTFPGIP